MTAGTKIFLAVFALIVGVLVVYYGVVVPGRQAALNVPGLGNQTASEADKPHEPPIDARSNAEAASPSTGDPAFVTSQPAQPTVNPPATASAGDLLSEGVRQATDGPNHMRSRLGSFLPLIGLNAGDLQTSGESAEVQPSVAAPRETVRERDSIHPIVKAPQASIGAPNMPVPKPPARVEYAIKTGDTFTSIAEDWFGDAAKWSLIAKANPTIDPQRLKVGQKVFLPPKESATVPAKAEPVTTNGEPLYLVQSGDTLMRIARTLFADGTRWEEIYQLNRETIGKDPAALQVGMKLKLPKKPK